MPLNWPVRELAADRQFWTDYFWRTHSEKAEQGYQELVNHRSPVTPEAIESYQFHGLEPPQSRPSIRLDVPVGSRALRLEFDPNLTMMTLSLTDRAGGVVELGWDDEAHWHPHVLRWEELDVISRYVAKLDEQLPHPGIGLLLFCRFVVIADDRDAAPAFAALRRAWGKLGYFSETEIERFIEPMDRRNAGIEWHRDPRRGWALRQDGRPQNGFTLYTLRHSENEAFPFEAFDEIISDMQRVVTNG